MPTAYLADRAVVLVSGEDAKDFLQDLITCDLESLADDEARLGGLLTPQGKVLFDFLISRAPGETAYRLDCAAAIAADLLKRLTLYKLRAKVTITQVMDGGSPVAVLASWDENHDSGVRDTRHAQLGLRHYVALTAVPAAPVGRAEYDAQRIGLGIPEGGIDFAFGDAFPHDADMDQLGGVGFKKGCYVGQEVVSRMEHRGTARRRIILAEGSALPAKGTEILANDRPVGTLASVAGDRALALVRLDRAGKAMNANAPLTANGTVVTLSIPDWAKFTWPEPAEAES